MTMMTPTGPAAGPKHSANAAGRVFGGLRWDEAGHPIEFATVALQQEGGTTLQKHRDRTPVGRFAFEKVPVGPLLDHLWPGRRGRPHDGGPSWLDAKTSPAPLSGRPAGAAGPRCTWKKNAGHGQGRGLI